MSKVKFKRNTQSSRELRRIAEREQNRQQRQQAMDAFWKLTPEERQFVRLRYYDELSQREIAERLGISQMQISRIEKKVLKKLRNLYFGD